MQRYVVSQFDSNTFVVVDTDEQREICICSNYEGCKDAEERCREIATLLNAKQDKVKNDSMIHSMSV